MKKHPREIVLALLLWVSLWPLAAAAAAAAPVEPLPPPMRARFDRAVDLLNRYRGDGSLLEAARAELDAVLQAHPRHAPAYRELARYEIMRGHINSDRFRPGALDAADALINRALELQPGFAEAYVLRGHLYRLMHRPDAAFAALANATQLGTTDPWLDNNWADLLVDQERYDEAAQRYRKVIDGKTPNRKAMSAAFQGLIRCYEETGRLAQADEAHRRLIDFEPDSAWKYGNYATFLLCERDEAEQAVARARQALQRMNYGIGRYWLAAGLYRLWSKQVLAGTPERGRDYLAEAQSLYPDIDEIVAQARSCTPLASVAKALALSRRGPSAGLAMPPLALAAAAGPR